MAAGLGFKTFTTGEVLTADNVNGYLMQGVLVFASAAARDAAITSPQEGQTCYLKDTDAVLTYSGSAWVNLASGYGLQEIVYFTSNGTFTKASYPKARAVIVTCVGGGGGSGGAATTGASQVSVGMPGGGGAYAQSLIPISSLGASETVTVGAGGSAGAAGNNSGTAGGDASFGSLVIAKGGGAGGGGAANPVPTMGNNPGSGGSGTASTGNFKFAGNASGQGIQVNASFPARPMTGFSIYSGSTGGDIISTGADGATGLSFGGGGIASVNSQSQATARAGGAGGAGVVIVEVLS
jgi:hypothetical protein